MSYIDGLRNLYSTQRKRVRLLLLIVTLLFIYQCTIISSLLRKCLLVDLVRVGQGQLGLVVADLLDRGNAKLIQVSYR